MTVLDHNRAKLDEMHVVKAREIAGFLGLNRSDTSSSTTQVAKAAKLAEGCGSMIVFEQWMRYQAGRRISPWDVRSGSNRQWMQRCVRKKKASP
jgi:hypothetical protein